MKAALLSAVLYPGTGHFFLKKKVRGALFCLIFSISLYFLVSDMIINTMQILDQINNGEISLNITVISELLATNSDLQELNFDMYILIIIWFLSIIDSYRLGLIKA